ncbi:FG-GAP-like repeat-containing protein [Luteococcus sp. OSA5]|uniref:FG-GAP-like repeat-containing protein n=1 Tax=Luteococcus sp. OSA5 TaxID=3401630 RepID=UPI003B42EB8D
MSRGTVRRAALAAVMSIGLVAGPCLPAGAQPTEDVDPRQSPARSERLSVGMKRTGMVQAQATTDITPAAALARINAERARYGVAALTLDTAASSALDNHARYVSLNPGVADYYSEDESLPGWTASGAEIAPYAEVIGVTTLRAAVDGMLSDPYLRDAMVLEETATTIGFGGHADVRTFVMRYTGENPKGYPRSYPTGNNFATLRNQAPWVSGYGCAGTGTPISASFDYGTYGAVTSATGTLKADGATVEVCTLPAAGYREAGAAMVPRDALRPGTHYSGNFAVTMNLLAGGSKTVNQPVEFTTAAPATGVAGDQTGDRVADILAVNDQGELYLYKMRSNGTIGHGWKIGRGWGAFDWISLAGDVNKDGRSDLMGRRSDGTMWLYHSQGVGAFRAGIRVGHGWSGLDLMTMVGDMNADGTRDLVARAKDGDLLRYNLGVSSMSAAGRIGTGWGSMKHLVGVGSLNGDKYDDIVAVRNDGTLWAYYSGADARIKSSRRIGQGWQGWTQLFVVGDVNGDGRLDMVGRNPDNELYTYLNQGTGWSAGIKAGMRFGAFRLFA